MHPGGSEIYECIPYYTIYISEPCKYITFSKRITFKFLKFTNGNEDQEKASWPISKAPYGLDGRAAGGKKKDYQSCPQSQGAGVRLWAGVWEEEVAPGPPAASAGPPALSTSIAHREGPESCAPSLPGLARLPAPGEEARDCVCHQLARGSPCRPELQQLLLPCSCPPPPCPHPSPAWLSPANDASPRLRPEPRPGQSPGHRCSHSLAPEELLGKITQPAFLNPPLSGEKRGPSFLRLWAPGCPPSSLATTEDPCNPCLCGWLLAEGPRRKAVGLGEGSRGSRQPLSEGLHALDFSGRTGNCLAGAGRAAVGPRVGGL